VNVTVFLPEELADNWGTLFGTRPATISFDVKALDAHEIPEIHFVLNNGATYFNYVVSVHNRLGRSQTSADGWQRFSIKWRATWSDETARRNGWKPNVEHARWSEVIKNPQHSCLVVVGKESGQGD